MISDAHNKENLEQILKDLSEVELEINQCYDKLYELNKIAFVGTVRTSSLGEIPKKIKLLDRRVRILFHKYEIANSWRSFDDIYHGYKINYKGKDVLDSDIEYIKSALLWALSSRDFVGFLLDINPKGSSIDSITISDLEVVTEKYTSDLGESIDRRFELLIKLKKQISISQSNQRSQGIHVSGVSGSNIIVNSSDASASINNNDLQSVLFADMLAAINAATTLQQSEQDYLKGCVQKLESSHKSGRFKEGYKEFMQNASAHVTIFAALLPAMAFLL